MKTKQKGLKNPQTAGALSFIFLMGIVSMFSDMTHEGGRSILGEFLNLAGASAATIGFVSGIGELLGYSLRLLSGFIADKTKHYWLLTILGFVIQVFALPLLALIPENGWIWACSLVILERLGKAVKKPAKNTLVSFASSEVGQGKGFAYQEFLDQLGAFLGPVILFGICTVKGTENLFATYKTCFAFLIIPAILTIIFLLISRFRYPHPETFEKDVGNEEPFKFKKSFVFYMIAICFFAFGFVDFTLVTLHAAKLHLVPESTLSLLYAGAMAIDAFSALLFGTLFDKIGMKSLIISTICTFTSSIFIFVGNSLPLLIVGIALWGIGMGAQESIMKAAVSKIVPKTSRSKGFGIFETGFGIAWFLGSWAMGALYDIAPLYLAITSVSTQIIAVPFYIILLKCQKKENDVATKSAEIVSLENAKIKDEADTAQENIVKDEKIDDENLH